VRLDFATFFEFNPAILSDCKGLVAGTYYCISINEDGGPPESLTPTSTSSSASSTGTAISTPTPTQDGMVSTCDSFYFVKMGDLCDDIAEDHGISREELNAWNPAIKSDCTGLKYDYYVCVGVYEALPTQTSSAPPSSTSSVTEVTPTPTQDGMVGGCGEFYLVQEGDGCWAIADASGISLDDFYKWNPAIGTDCAGLRYDFYVCIGLA
jgi:hypothetical protein